MSDTTTAIDGSPTTSPLRGSFETLNVRREAGVVFAEIAAPPMNLLGPELVRDLVALIQRAEGDDTARVLVFTSADPDYFISSSCWRVTCASRRAGRRSSGSTKRHLVSSPAVVRPSI